MLLQVFHLPFFDVVLVHEDQTVRRVKLLVQVKLPLAFRSDHLQQVSVPLDLLSQLTLSLLELCVLFLDVTDAFLLDALILELLIQNSL